MRITDLKASIVTTDIPWESLDPSRGNMQAILVQIFTDEGVVGTSFAWERLSTCRGLAEMLVNQVKPFLLGKSAFDRELIRQKLISWSRRACR